MGIFRYILFSVILIAVVEVYVYITIPATHEAFNQLFVVGFLDFSYPVELPIYVWLVVPAAVIFILSLLHLMYYGCKGYFGSRSIVKDKRNLLILAKARMIQEHTNVDIKDKELAEVAKILNSSELDIAANGMEESKKTTDSDYVIAIKNGEYISSKDFRISFDNPLYRINNINRISVDDDFAIEIINKKDEFDNEMIKMAFDKLLETKSMTTIKKVIENLELDKDMVKALLKKDASTEEQFRIDPLELDGYLRGYDFDAKDFVEIVREYKENGLNQSFIAMFENLSTENEAAIEAYLYVLIEFEMIDKIREILDNSDKTQFVAYRALLDLKESGKHYTIESLSYCTTC